MYRDEYERCPRCNLELVDAGSGRGCTQCQGIFIPEPVLREMANGMPTPPAPVVLGWEIELRVRIKCPSCGELMEAQLLNRVPIDRCKAHGVWFDRGELQAVLVAFANGRDR